MGLTERHWFEDEEPELTENQIAVYAVRAVAGTTMKQGSRKSAEVMLDVSQYGMAEGRK